MISFALSRAAWPVLAVALLVTACGAPPPITSKPPAPHSPQAQEVFSAGFTSIKDKYIHDVDVRKLATEGIKGFAAIDPALTVATRERTIRLYLAGDEIARSPTPSPADINGWAKLTVDLARQARVHSRDMHDASAEKLYEAVFDGALSELDLFSRYAGADEARRNRANRDGFGGIGIRFAIKSGSARVTEVMADMPADKAGMKKGDQITHIDSEPVAPQTRDIAAKLQGPPDSEVHVRVFRENEERSIDLTMDRQHIVPPTVTARLDGSVLFMRISNFNQGTAGAVAHEINAAKTTAKPSLSGLVLDLRGNPGGLLKQSIKVADLLLTHGHILSTRGRHPDSLHHYEAGGRDIADGLPVVVIIDGKSASASEIVAAALQDRDRAVVVGTSSFGKGSVQTVIRLPNDGEITLTWSRFLAPSGYTMHGLGVRPTVCTNIDEKGLKPFIERTIAERLKIRANFAAWRTPGWQDEAHRKSLRNACPAARRKGYDDVRIAKYLVDHRELYAQTLDIAATMTQAHN